MSDTQPVPAVQPNDDDEAKVKDKLDAEKHKPEADQTSTNDISAIDPNKKGPP